MTTDFPRPFALYRQQDVTGVSGEGTVAHGVQFADGTVVIRWLGEFASTVVWESLDAAMKVHGHDGKTRVVWAAPEAAEPHMVELVWRDGRGEEICRSTPLAPGTERIGIPIDAFCADLIPGGDDE